MDTTENRERTDAETAETADAAREPENERVRADIDAVTAEIERRVKNHVRDAGGHGGWRVW